MRYSPEQYAQAFFEAITSMPSDKQDVAIQNLGRLLKENGHLSLYPRIEKYLEGLLLSRDGIARAKFTTARQMDIGNDIVQLVQEISGKKLKVEQNVDPEVIGGLVVRIDDLLIDASMKRALSDLRAELTS